MPAIQSRPRHRRPTGLLACLIVVALAAGAVRCRATGENDPSANPAAAASSGPVFTLDECIDLALRQNPDVLVAKKRVEEAAGGVIEARAGYLPSVTASGEYKAIESDLADLKNSVTNRRDSAWNGSIRVTQTIFSGGGVQGRMAIAQLNRETRMLEYRSTIDRVIMETRIAFYDILRNRADIGVREKAVEFYTKQKLYESDRLGVGSGSQLQVLRAEVNLSLETAELTRARNSLRNAFIRLSELLAIDFPPERDGAPFDVRGELGYEPVTLTVPEAMERALRLRPELKVRKNGIAVQRKQLMVDRSAILPRISLFGGYDFVSERERKNKEYDYYEGYVIGAQVHWNLFDGMATFGRMQATRARLEAAEITRSDTETTIEAEVLRACNDLTRAAEVIVSQIENVKLAQESQDLAQSNFELGLTSQLDLLQSQLDLTRARLVEVVARFEYNAAVARLQRAMGGDFEITQQRAGEEAK